MVVGFPCISSLLQPLISFVLCKHSTQPGSSSEFGNKIRCAKYTKIANYQTPHCRPPSLSQVTVLGKDLGWRNRLPSTFPPSVLSLSPPMSSSHPQLARSRRKSRRTSKYEEILGMDKKSQSGYLHQRVLSHMAKPQYKRGCEISSCGCWWPPQDNPRW